MAKLSFQLLKIEENGGPSIFPLHPIRGKRADTTGYVGMGQA